MGNGLALALNTFGMFSFLCHMISYYVVIITFISMEIRRTPDVKIRFVGSIRFVSFNFGQVQLLRFVVVMVWSNSFGHFDLVK